METDIIVQENIINTLFKSYYVVWKPDASQLGTADVIKFKSYYVVWKPMIVWQFTAKTTTFKSYYVVWKQEDEENKKDKQTSLNRTM